MEVIIYSKYFIISNKFWPGGRDKITRLSTQTPHED